MNKIKNAFIFMLLLSTLLALGACAPTVKTDEARVTESKQLVMVFANWNETNSFAVLVREGVQKQADQMGVRIIAMDNKQDAQQANINADNAITQKVDFYFQYNQDTDINNRIAQKLIDAGIPAIAVQVPMGEFPIYNVDNVHAGELAGQAVAEAAKAAWDVEPIYLVLGYPEAGPLFQQRAEGALQGAQTVFPDIVYVEDTTKGDPETGRSVVANFMTAHPDQKIIIWTHVDQQALAALSAVKSAGREDDVFISSTGGDPSIFPELRNPESRIVGTSAFFPEEWGKELLSMAVEQLTNGTKPPAQTNPPTRFLTGENINEYYPEN